MTTNRQLSITANEYISEREQGEVANVYTHVLIASNSQAYFIYKRGILGFQVFS